MAYSVRVPLSMDDDVARYSMKKANIVMLAAKYRTMPILRFTMTSDGAVRMARTRMRVSSFSMMFERDSAKKMTTHSAHREKTRVAWAVKT